MTTQSRLSAGVSRRHFLARGAMAAMACGGRGIWPQTATSAPTTVKTPDGLLRGQVIAGVRVFKGVPFAHPPLGLLRFQPATPARPWAGERDATQFAAAAMQSAGPSHKSEDCLYLNVWAPLHGTDTNHGAGLPVFVWIHGGGFTGGYSFAPGQNGTEFAKAGVIVVTVAYRLGVFGFLDWGPILGSEFAGSANNGLSDVINALSWVQRNIGAFGGDASRVTLGGQSAGAKMVGILMGVPAADGLFSSMISESGGAERVWPTAQAEAVAKGFESAWGQPAQTLRDADADALIVAQKAFLDGWPQHYPLRCELDARWLNRMPLDSIASGSTKGKRLLIGTNLDESAAFLGPHPDHDATAADLANLPLARFDQVYAQYQKLYPNLSAERLRIRAVTAEEYWVPSLRAAEAHVQGGGTAWMYRLDYAPSSGRMKGYAAHSEEVPMVWNQTGPAGTDAIADSELPTQIHRAWVAFLKGDAPAAAGLPVWPRYEAQTRPTMILDATSRVVQRPAEEELRLWD